MKTFIQETIPITALLFAWLALIIGMKIISYALPSQSGIYGMQ